jgi:UDP-N-acetylglucosamine:LPS N-acetylglucosamine transferase
MSRFLLTWEIGGGYGHVATLLPLAEELRRRGHEALFAVRNVATGEAILGPRGYAVLQAPTWIGPSPKTPWAETFPGILLSRGYHEPASLAAMIKAWLHLFDMVQPDFIIGHYAPTAAIAASLRGTLCGAVGTGFVCPPRVTPLPVLPKRPTTPEQQLRVEALLLDSINGALQRCGGRAVAAVIDVFPSVDDVLTTFPELDHYGASPGRTYWGTIDPSFVEAVPAWPDAAGERILVFVDSSMGGFDKLVADLTRLGQPTLMHARALDRERAAALTTATMVVSPEPVDLARALDDASLVICHASHGMTSKALLRGVPTVLLPNHNEQAATRDRVVALGAGVGGPVAKDPEFDYAALAEEVLGDPGFATGAAAFAERYAGYDPAASTRRIVDAYEMILHGCGGRLAAGSA